MFRQKTTRTTASGQLSADCSEVVHFLSPFYCPFPVASDCRNSKDLITIPKGLTSGTQTLDPEKKHQLDNLKLKGNSAFDDQEEEEKDEDEDEEVRNRFITDLRSNGSELRSKG